MSKILSGTPSPDTSPASVARVLKEAARRDRHMASFFHAPGLACTPSLAAELDAHANTLYALADALDTLPAPLTATPWEERVERASRAIFPEAWRTFGEGLSLAKARLLNLAEDGLMAAFPELAPEEPTP